LEEETSKSCGFPENRNLREQTASLSSERNGNDDEGPRHQKCEIQDESSKGGREQNRSEKNIDGEANFRLRCQKEIN
jgi:hypothetical protein